MRWPEAKILDAISHPEKLVRQVALEHFAVAGSINTAVMPRVMQVVAAYGLADAFWRLHILANLPQSEASIEWAIRELRQRASDQYFNVADDLSHLLSRADPALLSPRQHEILSMPQFSANHRKRLVQRLELASWDAERCWREMESLCNEAIKSPDFDFPWERCVLLAEAAGRQGQDLADRVLALLGDPPDEAQSELASWMATFLVQLAGYLRLEAALPLLTTKLRTDQDNLSEDCASAFTRIGTDAVAEVVTQDWQDQAWPFRLHASAGMEGLRCDGFVNRSLQLLPLERDLAIKTSLASGLLRNLVTESIEPVRQLVLYRQYDPQYADLEHDLAACAILMECDFPELADWKQAGVSRAAARDERIKALQTPSATPPARSIEPAPKAVPYLRIKARIGRNDSCPCGSGKKFKKCCLNKSKISHR